VKQVIKNYWIDVLYHDFSRLLLSHVVHMAHMAAKTGLLAAKMVACPPTLKPPLK
jgi:hypothetical protein